MPLWLRRFVYKKIEEHYTKQKDEHQKQNAALNLTKDKAQLAKPNIQPTYTAKGTK